MEPSPERNYTPVKHPLLAMIAECEEDGRPLDALHTLRTVEESEEGSGTAVAAQEDQARTAHFVQPFDGYDEAAFMPSQGVVAQRLSTPERIRKRTTKLYGEIHELMDRHDMRNERQRDMVRRDSGAYRRQSNLQALEERRRSSSGTGTRTVHEASAGRHARSSSSAAANGQLPDLYQEFEDSRRRHLLALQSQRSAFPPKEPSCEPPAPSDPDSFSLRFQTITLGHARK